MNDWNNDDQAGNGPGVPEAPEVATPSAPPQAEAPQAAPPQVAPPQVQAQAPAPGPMDMGPSMPMDNYADLDADVKIGSGNKGMLIGFLILLALGGVIGFLWWQDHNDYAKWDVKLQEALKIKDDTQFTAAMRDIMQNCKRQDILVQVAFELGEAEDAQAVPLLAKAVSQGEELGQEAALALAKINTPEAKTAADAIFKQMQESEELRRAKYAWALVVLEDDRGFGPLLEGVSKQIVNTKTIAGYTPDVIARMGTTDKLIELASDKDPMLKIYAAMELGFRDDKDPVPALLQLLQDDNKKVAEAAAISLGRTADDRAGKALLAKIQQAPDMLGPILSSVTQSVGAPGLEAIYKNTEAPDIKYKIIGKLKQLKDPRAADLLISITEEQFPGSDEKSKLEADEIRNQALWALEELGDPRIGEKMYAKTQWEPIDPEAIPDDAVRYRQEDMARKIANGVVTWFGEAKPEGAADYLEKIYDANAPFENSPECAKRVKVDIGPLMDSMGRIGDSRFCNIVEPFLTKDEGFFSQAASMALGKLKCPGTAAKFKKAMVMTATERKEEKFSTLIESRDWQMEGRLQERRNSIIASRYLGDPSLAETLMDIAMDPVDDPELRAEASNSLAYVADDAAMDMILEKVKDDSLDSVARASLIKGLWHNPSKNAVEAMMSLLEGEGNDQFVKAAAIVVGEAGETEYEERLNKLLDHPDENRRRGAVMAILLGGNLDRLDRILEILKDQESMLVIREWYQTHPVYLSEDIFKSKRIYTRLRIANAIAEKTQRDEIILWPWKYLMDRLDKGWDTSPGGLTALQVRQHLVADVKNDAENRELAAQILRGLNERGFLLALQAGDGDYAEVARRVVHMMNQTSQ
ncbi:MAG: HEAT repeat domain-containing protein [Deltaproteobacteria bacterium]|nr:HEAT repeat domain-containing protein [Deltaproteobacteria bacterium]MBN2670376.1 HEAT repeat domain-containing protein [Deltaproteobacteria bacterium]